MLYVPRNVIKQIVALCKADQHAEVCGVLIGQWRGTEKRVGRIVPVENVAQTHRETRYRIDDRVILALENTLRGSAEEILGFYHSHLNSSVIPSQHDTALAWEAYSYLIVTVDKSGGESYASWVMESRSTGFQKELLKLIEGEPTAESLDTRRDE